MPVPGFALGIDLGTSNTAAVLRWPDGRVKPVLFDGTPLLPSAVYAEPDRSLLTGRDAVHSARVDPARYEPNPKRRIDDGTVLLGDTEVPVVDLFAAVLGRVVEEATRITGGTVPASTTLTCPATWAAPRRAVLTGAAARAGLGGVRLVDEPVAAAAYFVSVLGRDVAAGSVVAVHDLGAGTFDASVVARTADGGFEVLAVDGRGDIGGLDIDAAIVAHLGRLCASRDPDNWARLTTPSTVEDRRYRRLLWDDVRVAKERLSRAQSADLVLPLLNIDVHLTREELDRLAQPLLEQTVQVTQGAMRWAQQRDPRPTAGVFLVGGASRIPLMATLLHRAIGEPPVAIEQPELVVAEGSLFATSTRPTDPAATVLVSVVPLSGATPTPWPVSGPPVPEPVPPAPGVEREPAFVPGRAALVERARTPEMAPTRAMPQLPQRAAAPAEVARVESARPYQESRGGGFGPFARRLFVTVLLGATPVVAAYVTYKLALHESLLPIRVAWDKIM
jgi:molecular chaperone DnaK (HSP70)